MTDKQGGTWLLTHMSLITETSSEWQQSGRKCLIDVRGQNWVGDHRMATGIQMLHHVLARRNYGKKWPVCLNVLFPREVNFLWEQPHPGFVFRRVEGRIDGCCGLPPVATWWWRCWGGQRRSDNLCPWRTAKRRSFCFSSSLRVRDLKGLCSTSCLRVCLPSRRHLTHG